MQRHISAVTAAAVVVLISGGVAGAVTLSGGQPAPDPAPASVTPQRVMDPVTLSPKPRDAQAPAVEPPTSATEMPATTAAEPQEPAPTSEPAPTEAPSTTSTSAAPTTSTYTPNVGGVDGSTNQPAPFTGAPIVPPNAHEQGPPPSPPTDDGPSPAPPQPSGD